jgi:hypothetical protein
VQAQARWIRSVQADTALALAWIPFAAVAVALRGDVDHLGVYLAALLFLSLLHQPLTLTLVYADPVQLAAHRRLFLLAPLVLGLAVVAGLTISFALVALIGGLWNLEHTLMQRYGIARIYGRKVGEDDGHLERALLLAWLVTTLLSVSANPGTERRVASLPIGGVNESGVHQLAALRPYASALLLPVAVYTFVLTVRWVRVELSRRRAGVANPAKQLYVGSTLAMFAWAMLVDPVSGLAGFGGAHAIEYFFVVHHTLTRRSTTAAPLDALVRRARGASGFLLVYALGLLALFACVRLLAAEQVYTFVVLSLGGLHFLFDSFIWKSPRAAPAAPAQPIPANVNA